MEGDMGTGGPQHPHYGHMMQHHQVPHPHHHEFQDLKQDDWSAYHHAQQHHHHYHDDQLHLHPHHTAHHHPHQFQHPHPAHLPHPLHAHHHHQQGQPQQLPPQPHQHRHVLSPGPDQVPGGHLVQHPVQPITPQGPYGHHSPHPHAQHAHHFSALPLPMDSTTPISGAGGPTGAGPSGPAATTSGAYMASAGLQDTAAQQAIPQPMQHAQSHPHPHPHPHSQQIPQQQQQQPPRPSMSTGSHLQLPHQHQHPLGPTVAAATANGACASDHYLASGLQLTPHELALQQQQQHHHSHHHQHPQHHPHQQHQQQQHTHTLAAHGHGQLSSDAGQLQVQPVSHVPVSPSPGQPQPQPAPQPHQALSQGGQPQPSSSQVRGQHPAVHDMSQVQGAAGAPQQQQSAQAQQQQQSGHMQVPLHLQAAVLGSQGMAERGSLQAAVAAAAAAAMDVGSAGGGHDGRQQPSTARSTSIVGASGASLRSGGGANAVACGASSGGVAIAGSQQDGGWMDAMLSSGQETQHRAKRQRGSTWSPDEELRLISLYVSLKDQVNQRKTLWADIAAGLSAIGTDRTANSVLQRWSGLLSSFRVLACYLATLDGGSARFWAAHASERKQVFQALKVGVLDQRVWQALSEILRDDVGPGVYSAGGAGEGTAAAGTTRGGSPTDCGNGGTRTDGGGTSPDKEPLAVRQLHQHHQPPNHHQQPQQQPMQVQVQSAQDLQQERQQLQLLQPQQQQQQGMAGGADTAAVAEAVDGALGENDGGVGAGPASDSGRPVEELESPRARPIGMDAETDTGADVPTPGGLMSLIVSGSTDGGMLETGPRATAQTAEAASMDTPAADGPMAEDATQQQEVGSTRHGGPGCGEQGDQQPQSGGPELLHHVQAPGADQPQQEHHQPPQAPQPSPAAGAGPPPQTEPSSQAQQVQLPVVVAGEGPSEELASPQGPPQAQTQVLAPPSLQQQQLQTMQALQQAQQVIQAQLKAALSPLLSTGASARPLLPVNPLLSGPLLAASPLLSNGPLISALAGSTAAQQQIAGNASATLTTTANPIAAASPSAALTANTSIGGPLLRSGPSAGSGTAAAAVLPNLPSVQGLAALASASQVAAAAAARREAATAAAEAAIAAEAAVQASLLERGTNGELLPGRALLSSLTRNVMLKLAEADQLLGRTSAVETERVRGCVALITECLQLLPLLRQQQLLARLPAGCTGPEQAQGEGSGRGHRDDSEEGGRQAAPAVRRQCSGGAAPCVVAQRRMERLPEPFTAQAGVMAAALRLQGEEQIDAGCSPPSEELQQREQQQQQQQQQASPDGLNTHMVQQAHQQQQEVQEQQHGRLRPPEALASLSPSLPTAAGRMQMPAPLAVDGSLEVAPPPSQLHFSSQQLQPCNPGSQAPQDTIMVEAEAEKQQFLMTEVEQHIEGANRVVSGSRSPNV